MNKILSIIILSVLLVVSVAFNVNAVNGNRIYIDKEDSLSIYYNDYKANVSVNENGTFFITTNSAGGSNGYFDIILKKSLSGDSRLSVMVGKDVLTTYIDENADGVFDLKIVNSDSGLSHYRLESLDWILDESKIR